MTLINTTECLDFGFRVGVGVGRQLAGRGCALSLMEQTGRRAACDVTGKEQLLPVANAHALAVTGLSAWGAEHRKVHVADRKQAMCTDVVEQYNADHTQYDHNSNCAN